MRLALYVPSREATTWHTGDYGRSWGDLLGNILNIAGGYTQHTAFGAWKNSSGSVVHEPVTIIEVFTEDLGTAVAIKNVFREYAVVLLESGEQEVMAVIDGRQFLWNRKNIV